MTALYSTQTLAMGSMLPVFHQACLYLLHLQPLFAAKLATHGVATAIGYGRITQLAAMIMLKFPLAHQQQQQANGMKKIAKPEVVHVCWSHLCVSLQPVLCSDITLQHYMCTKLALYKQQQQPSMEK